MKVNLVTVLSAIALIGFVSVGTVYADDAQPSTESHDAHHPDTKTAKTGGKSAAENTGGMMGGDMMGKMDMNQMMDMMHGCMEQHKDGKMCDHDMMTKCQENMDKSQCQKMMKEAKKEEKNKKK